MRRPLLGLFLSMLSFGAFAEPALSEVSDETAYDFASIKGAYSGLAEQQGEVVLQLTARGRFTATVKAANQVMRFKGQFDEFGYAEVEKARRTEPVRIEMQISPMDYSTRVIGVLRMGGELIGFTIRRSWYAATRSYSPHAGKLALELKKPGGADQVTPEVVGTGTVRVSKFGRTSLTARMFDGRKMSHGGYEHAEAGYEFFISSYRGAGCLCGSVSFFGAPRATVFWAKPATAVTSQLPPELFLDLIPEATRVSYSSGGTQAGRATGGVAYEKIGTGTLVLGGNQHTAVPSPTGTYQPIVIPDRSGLPFPQQGSTTSGAAITAGMVTGIQETVFAGTVIMTRQDLFIPASGTTGQEKTLPGGVVTLQAGGTGETGTISLRPNAGSSEAFLQLGEVRTVAGSGSSHPDLYDL